MVLKRGLIPPRADSPNCLGATHGEHIQLIQLAGSGSSYFCRKKYFFVVLLAVCDSNYRFTFVDICSYVYCSKNLKVNALHIPRDKPIRTGGEPLPLTFVGDEAFALSTHMQRPCGGEKFVAGKENVQLSHFESETLVWYSHKTKVASFTEH
ncbi:hypothetical protein PR048_022447 [Dryococelus australis]|uniref:DDE Tnp4 domain-containing protein n=1 Tax=Dryococelus australis TaxID=614101 RepID=A0ABQ9H135_9NEOP|nr:hypothetical protein PR048_022447 [Dryococelus australis]